MGSSTDVTIPSHWVDAQLDSICNMVYGKGLLTKHLLEDGYPVYGANGIIGKYNSYLYEKPQVIISCRGAACGVIHKTVEKSFITSNSIVLNRKSDLIDLDYFKHAMVSIDKTSVITGSAQPQITIENLKTLSIPLPPLNEQKRIVEKLDAILPRVQRAKARLEKIPMIIKKFRQSVLAAACSGRLTEGWRFDYARRTGEELPEWKVKKTSELFSFVTSGSRGWAKYYSEEGALFIRIGNLDHGSIYLDLNRKQFVNPPVNSEGTRTKVQKNDILISITADVGMVGLIPCDFPEAYINQHIALARPLKIVFPKYLAWYLSSSEAQFQFQEMQRGATKVGLGLDDIKNVEVPFPSFEEQQEIVRRVEKLFALADSLEAKYQKSFARVEKIEQAVLAKAFRGELVDADPNDEPAEELLKRIMEEKEKIEGGRKRRPVAKKSRIT